MRDLRTVHAKFDDGDRVRRLPGQQVAVQVEKVKTVKTALVLGQQILPTQGVGRRGLVTQDGYPISPFFPAQVLQFFQIVYTRDVPTGVPGRRVAVGEILAVFRGVRDKVQHAQQWALCFFFGTARHQR